jgi:hypothetical protein
LIFLLGLFISGKAQSTFKISYFDSTSQNGFIPCDGLSTRDGDILVIGISSRSNVRHDVWLLKIDRHGNKIFSAVYNANQLLYARKILETNDGFLICGHLNTAPSFLIKIDRNGNIIWSKSYSEAFIDMDMDADSNLYFTGGKQNGITMWDYIFLKTDKNGSVLWSKTFGTIEDDMCWSSEVTADGGLITIGSTFGATIWDSTGAKMLIVKIDSSGNEIWGNAYDLDSAAWNNNQGMSLTKLTQDGYVGHLLLQDSIRSLQPCLFHLHETGTIDWIKGYFTPTNMHGAAMFLQKLNGNIVGTATEEYQNLYSSTAIETDLQGNLISNRFFMPADSITVNDATCIFQGIDSSFIIVQRGTIPSTFYSNATILKLDWNESASCNDSIIPMTVVSFPKHRRKSVGNMNALVVNSGTMNFTIEHDSIYSVNNCQIPLGIINSENSHCKIFPNPTIGEFYIVTPSPIQNPQIEIYNVLGKKVYSTAREGVVAEINLNVELVSGTYLIRIVSNTITYTEVLLTE